MQTRTNAPRSRDSGYGLIILGMVFLLVLWGLLTIVSAQSGENSPMWLAARQLLFVSVGAVSMALAAAIPFPVHVRACRVYALLAIVSLLLLPLYGVRINGMRGWFSFGTFLVQPSEIIKPVFLLFLAAKASERGGSSWTRTVSVTVFSAALIVPIWLQPDFGTAMVYALTLGTLLILQGASWRHVLWCAAAVTGAGLLFVMYNPYAMRRLVGFVWPDADPGGSGWHIRQFQLAIAHGHWFGTKLGQAYWSNAYLPLPYNDSAYATMSETLGLVGTFPVLAFFALLCHSLLHDALREDLPQTSRFYLAGAAFMLAIQAMIHISVNVGLLPPTGLTLPFISYGGSSMVGSCLMIGMAFSARRAGRDFTYENSSRQAIPTV